MPGCVICCVRVGVRSVTEKSQIWNPNRITIKKKLADILAANCGDKRSGCTVGGLILTEGKQWAGFNGRFSNDQQRQSIAVVEPFFLTEANKRLHTKQTLLYFFIVNWPKWSLQNCCIKAVSHLVLLCSRSSWCDDLNHLKPAASR